MASIFKQQYTSRDPTGKRVKKKSQCWYIDYKTAEGTRKRVKGFKDKAYTAQLAAKLERETDQARAGIIDKYKKHRLRPLSEHIEDFRRSLGDTTKHARQTENVVKRVFTACKFCKWTDISASRFLNHLQNLKNNSDISQRTFNFYLKAGKQFCRWMVQDQRANDSPLEHLKCETVTKQRRNRRALEPDEIRRLLEATQAAPERFGMSGKQRAMLYRLAVETGLRASELRSLTVSSFDFGNCTVTIEAAYSKHRRRDQLPLRPSTSDELRGFLSGKMPNVRVFNMPEKTAKMLRADLADAGIPYVDDSGRYADFHSLRHSTGSLLAASGVHPKVAQSIMRHSDINLTMSLYTHTLRGQESEAVGHLPDLSQPSKGSQKLTGTDGQPVGAYKKLTNKSYFDCKSMSSKDPEQAQGLTAVEQNGRGAKSLQMEDIGTDTDPMSPADNGAELNGRCRIRTCDRLIKSQLLYRLS